MKDPNTKFLVLVVVTTVSLLTVQSYAQSRGPGGGQRGPNFNMQSMLEKLDADDDGVITSEEIEAHQQAQLLEYDSNGDGTLNIEEFSALWSQLSRERMVNDFQAIDNDGTGELTTEELNARTDALMSRLDQDGDGSIVISEIQRRDGSRFRNKGNRNGEGRSRGNNDTE